jgi:hypothetical protein
MGTSSVGITQWQPMHAFDATPQFAPLRIIGCELPQDPCVEEPNDDALLQTAQGSAMCVTNV